MKFLRIAPAMLFGLVLASSAFAAPALVCSTKDAIDGWDGSDTHAKLVFTAYVTSSTELSQAEVRGAYSSDARDLTANPSYQPTSPRYFNFNKFDVLEDAWCWFSPLLPKNIGDFAVGTRFTGYVRMMCEEGAHAATHKLSCVLK